jgi:hypothetical protein
VSPQVCVVAALTDRWEMARLTVSGGQECGVAACSFRTKALTDYVPGAIRTPPGQVAIPTVARVAAAAP